MTTDGDRAPAGTSRAEVEGPRAHGGERVPSPSDVDPTLGAVLEANPVATCVVARDRTLLHANAACLALLGPGARVGARFDPPWSALDEAGRALAREDLPLARLLERGERLRGVRLVARWPDGTRRHLAIDGVVLPGADGAPERAVLHLHDRTAERRREAQVREHRGWLELALEAAEMGIWSWDVASDEVRWSDELAAICGVELDEFDGTFGTGLTFVHPADRAMVDRRLKEAIESGASGYELVHRLQRPDGTTRWVEARGRVLRTPDGAARGVTGAILDVSSRMEADLALRESEAALRALLESVPVTLVRVDRHRRILRASRPGAEGGHESLDDATLAEILGASADAALERAFETGETQLLECSTVAADGEPATVLVRMGPVLVDGRVESVTVVGTDVTPRKRAEDALRDSREQLRRAQRLESVGRLAGGVAHDFNNLLTVVTSCVGLLQRELQDGTRAHTLLAPLAEAAERGSRLTRQLLGFASKQVVEPEVVLTNHLVLDALNMLERLLGEDVELVTRLAPDAWPLEIDPGQFEQLLVNLAINARDAMPDGGRLTISTANRPGSTAACPGSTADRPDPGDGVGATEAGDHVVLTVEDTGVGISADQLPLVFEPFFTTKGPGEGTGLGLATSFGIARQAGGSIDVRSEVGSGTAFRVLLPRARAGLVVRPRPRRRLPAAAPGSAGWVLLVEDDPMVRRLTRALLEDAGFELLEAEDGRRALELYDEHEARIVLVVTDVVMPRLGGLELAERLLARRRDLPVLLVSGYATEPASLGLLPGEHVGVLSKPYSGEALRSRIAELLPASDPAG